MAWYIDKQSNGYYIVRDLPQHGPNAFEYRDNKCYQTRQEAEKVLRHIQADLAREDAMFGVPGDQGSDDD